MSDFHNNKPFKPTKIGIIKAIGKKIGSAIKGEPKVFPDIKSVKPTTNIAGSVSKVKKDAAFKNFKNVQNLKKKKDEGKKMFKEAQTELRRAVETKRATQIGDSIYHRNVPADPSDLRNERSAKAFKGKKGKELEKKAKGGRVGLKFGSKKSNVQKIKETFNPKKSAAKKKKFPDLTGDGKVTFADILKGRGVKRG